MLLVGFARAERLCLSLSERSKLSFARTIQSYSLGKHNRYLMIPGEIAAILARRGHPISVPLSSVILVLNQDEQSFGCNDSPHGSGSAKILRDEICCAWFQ